MTETRAALYLDFDNVFSGLLKVDPDAAVKFANEPGTWLAALATKLTISNPRRWAVARCYLNPSGSVVNPKRDDDPPKLYFHRFRQGFVHAGFEVVDCPRLTTTKNAADIRLVVDAMDALRADCQYNEFVIMSGDSDMTPLLYRLRAADRRITIISPSDAAAVLASVTDRFVDSRALIDLIVGEPVDDDAPVLAPANSVDAAASPDPSAPVMANESALSTATSSELLETRKAWEDTTPDVVKRITPVLNLPKLPREYWLPLFGKLAEFARTKKFNLTEITRWTRDQLVDEGVHISRGAAASAVRGVNYGGAELYRTPPPTFDELREAFCANVLERATHAGLELTDDEIATIREWLTESPPDKG